MTTEPRYTPAAIGMSRWYFRVGGLVLIASGAAVILSLGGEHALEAGTLVVLGAGALVYSFLRSGDRVADAAREYMNLPADD